MKEKDVVSACDQLVSFQANVCTVCLVTGIQKQHVPIDNHCVTVSILYVLVSLFLSYLCMFLSNNFCGILIQLDRALF